MADHASDARHVVERYWEAAEARDWAAFGALLADDVVYEAPQTRERVRGRAAYVRFNVEYPGDWHVRVERAVGDQRHAASWIRFDNEGTVETGLCFFDVDDHGKISRITDFWPEPYEPPPGREHLVERWQRDRERGFDPA
jgi:ketosteroid isomerase-like protein